MSRPRAETMPAVTDAAQAEGVADRQHPVADLRLVGIAEGNGRQRLVGADAQHGDVGARVGAQQFRADRGVVGQDDVDLVRAVDDVVVRHDDALRRIDDEAGAERLAAPLRALRLLRAAFLAGTVAVEEVAEEFLERAARRSLRHFRRIRPPRPRLHRLGGRDIDHRRQQLARQRREGFRRALRLGGRGHGSARQHGGQDDDGEAHGGEPHAE